MVPCVVDAHPSTLKRRQELVVILYTVLLGSAFATGDSDRYSKDSITGSEPLFRTVPGHDGHEVIGVSQMKGLGIHRLEGSFYTRTSDGMYNYLSAGELPAPPGWSYPEMDIHMRFDHWRSADGENWSFVTKLYESSGTYDGSERRASTWAPMAAFDSSSNRWHLFYVAYRGSPDYRIPLGLYGNMTVHRYTQWDGEIWHAVSRVLGDDGIGGPYDHLGAILNQEDQGGFEPAKDQWEGDHGCDMFFPYQLSDGTWMALYGSQGGRFPNFCGPGPSNCRQVGLVRASAHGFSGNWTRLSSLNPLDRGFRPATPGIENPVVVKTADNAWFVAVYVMPFAGNKVGVSFSRDGIEWKPSSDIVVNADACGGQVSTACGLVPEPQLGKGVYSLLYTAAGEMSTHLSTGTVCRAYVTNAGEVDTLIV